MLTERCVKCGLMASTRYQYCGPSERQSICMHTMGDSTEHLLVTCSCCGYTRYQRCADAKEAVC